MAINRFHFNRFHLVGEDHLDELLVVDVALRVLLAVDEGLHLLFTHLLAQGGQHVAELGAGDEAVAVLEDIMMTAQMIEYEIRVSLETFFVSSI